MWNFYLWSLFRVCKIRILILSFVLFEYYPNCLVSAHFIISCNEMCDHLSNKIIIMWLQYPNLLSLCSSYAQHYWIFVARVKTMKSLLTCPTPTLIVTMWSWSWPWVRGRSWSMHVSLAHCLHAVAASEAARVRKERESSPQYVCVLSEW